MFRFFRNIRHPSHKATDGTPALLAENKTVRYLKYAVGEVLLIMVGILLALQIQNWNEGRKDRIEEREAVVRLDEELEKAFIYLSGSLERIKGKASDLNKIQKVLKGRLIEDKYAFLSDIAKTMRYSWAHPDFPRTAFEEINSSGKISLIQNTELRNQIQDLYRRWEMVERNVVNRRSDYAALAYRLIPRENEYDVADDMSEEELAVLVEAVLDSTLNQSLTAEINRSGYEILTYESVLEDIRDLRLSMKAELTN